MKVLLASGNPRKAGEFKKLFNPQIISIVEGEPLEVPETGRSYVENACLKAGAYYQKFQVPVMADDSGLEVEALPGELGVYSARFGGPGLDDRQRCGRLLEKMEGQTDRRAVFTCVLCFYRPTEVWFFEGRLAGRIAHRSTGREGFGYDPLFIPCSQEQSLANIPEWKAAHSHRRQAVDHAERFFARYLPP